MKPTKTIKCDDCKKELTGKIQVYPKEGGVLCERCNSKKRDIV